jgi:mannose-1-phosphate guanylyltransferase
MKADDEAKRTARALILAGGDGTRLLSLTRQIAGRNLPKQFCSILGKKRSSSRRVGASRSRFRSSGL